MSSNLKITKICAYCGERFIAQKAKASTRFCSHKCSQRAYKEKLKRNRIASVDVEKLEQVYFSTKKLQKSSLQNKPSPIDLTNLNSKEYLSLRETAIVLGVGKSTVHRYCVAGTLKCIRMNRRIVIRREDIDGIFEQAPSYRAMPRPAKMPRDTIYGLEKAEDIVEYYSAEEVAEKYGYTKSAVHKMAAKRRIPKKLFEGVYLYCKIHIDELYGDKLPDESIMEWYSTKEMMEIYSLSLSQIYGMASGNKIPKRNSNGKTLYSKSHIDAIMQVRNGDESIIDWYTMDDIYKQYMMQSKYVANFAFVNNIPRKKEGTKALYSKAHFDEAVRVKNPQTEHISISDAMERYKLSRDSIYALVGTHNIPKLKNGKYVKIQRLALEKIINPKNLLNYGKS